mgnify:CR=1 FL=1
MRILAWISGVLVLLAGGAVAAVLLIDWGRYNEEVASLAGGLLGRDVAIGAMAVDVGWTTQIRLEKVTVANTDWASGERFLSVDRADVAVRVWPLLWGETHLPRLVISGATADLERRADGTANWQFDAPGEAAARGVTPDEAGDFPVIGHFEIDASTVSLVDRQSGVELKGDIRAADGTAEKSGGLQLALKGSLRGAPVRIEFAGGPVSILRDGGRPYPVDLDARAGATRVTARGEIGKPQDLQDIRLKMTARGPDLARLLPALNLPLPNTPPYDLAADVAYDDDRWTAENLKGSIGESDIAGRLTVDLSGEKPVLGGDLKTKLLHFDDLAPLIGLRPPAGSGGGAAQANGASRPAASGAVPNAQRMDGIFPDVPLDEERLETANVDLKYSAAEIRSDILPFDSIRGHVTVKDSRLTLSELAAGVADGRIAGQIVLDARPKTPSAAAELRLHRVRLKPFFRNSRFVEEMGGTFDGTVSLSGRGRTMADVMAVADGRVQLGMTGGSVSGLLVEAAGLDLVEALALLIEDARVPVRCARIDGRIRSGLVGIERAVIDTTDSTLLAAGKIHLGTQKLDVRVEARAKDFSLIDLAAPVRISGALNDPGIAIGGIDPLPFLEMGEQEDVSCAGLLRGLPGRSGN